jgi:hypothetical protein
MRCDASQGALARGERRQPHVIDLAAAGPRLTRELAARATAYLHARTCYRIVDPAAVDVLCELWGVVLGERDLNALDDLYARVLWIPDGELDRLDHAAREYRQIVGDPDEPPSRGGSGEPAGSGEDGGEAPSGGSDSDGGAGADSLADALEHAIAAARSQQLEQLDDDVDLEQLLGTRPRAAGMPPGSAAAPACRPAGCPTAASTGRRTPTRCSTATPTGCARRSPTARARSTSAPPAGASTAAPTPAAGRSWPPAGRSPATRGGWYGR